MVVSKQVALPDLKIFTCISVTAEKDLENAQLVQILHRLLSDDRSAPEIKYNSMVLICALIGSGEYSGEAASQDLCMQYSSLLQLNTERVQTQCDWFSVHNGCRQKGSIYCDCVVSICSIKDEAVNSVLNINCRNLTLASVGCS